eukprot:TRINITY_DN1670_c0_g1_i1.p1 TRINITY_DN1670_c0_g1~~TRINITY_DN1670_c0_g1_i1.p1  ORF type:complete len:200 (+),score=65.53 TRINITY_DN1670_c0_g1_i1:233-832(+)
MSERIQQFENNQEREHLESLADLYGIVVAIERVETAYVRSKMAEEDYVKQCKMLLSKYQSLYQVLEGSIGSLAAFLAEYRSSYPTAVARIKKGVPLGGNTQEASSGQDILEAGQYMITFVDTLKMGQVSADALQPILIDIVTTVGKLFPDLLELEPVRNWLRIVNEMKAAEELNPDQARQAQFDIEACYGAFSRRLASK